MVLFYYSLLYNSFLFIKSDTMISIINLSMRFGAKVLFRNVSLQFNPGNRYGLVGANGSGKSTLMKILIGQMTSETGDVVIPSQASVGTLQQDHYLYEDVEILQVVMQGRPLLWDALEKQKKLFEKSELTTKDCEDLEALEQIIVAQNGYTATSEAAKLLEGLGIRDSLHQKPLSILSGGYKLRVLLAKVLFGNPSLLILDEPTNHLDLYSIKWLEGYLQSFPGTLLLSSHDRNFLNAVSTHIADIDYGTIKVYKGNYDAFIEQKKLDNQQREIVLAKHDKRRQDLQGFIDRFGAKASKARQAQSKAKLVEKLEEQMDELELLPSSRIYPKIQFKPYRSPGVRPLVVKGIAKSYGPKKVLENIHFEIEKGDRLALIGPNGIGKSTLLGILTSHLPSDEGTFQWGFATRVAYFPQDHSHEVQGSISLLNWLGERNPELNQEQLRDALGRVLFTGDIVHQPVSTLSGGEAARLILAKMMLLQPNVLIFDEPTNHLDMEAIDELTRALKDYEETVIFVSHNRYFVGQVANRILEITDKGIKDFRGSYEEYLEKQAVDHLAQPASLKHRYGQEGTQENAKSTPGLSYEEQKKLRNMRSQLKRKAEQAESLCAKLEIQIAELNKKMGSDDFYALLPLDQQIELGKQKQSLEQKLEEAFGEWEKANLALEQGES